ncbi:MAG: hypothetical protein U0670_11030 [Anaerolineae bacterium]
MRKLVVVLGLCTALLILTLAPLANPPAVEAQTAPDTRPFHMGFTPLPYAISFEAVDFTYRSLVQDSDLIVHHFDDGVPWVEALNNQPYSDHIMNDWADRVRRTEPLRADHKVMLDITPINFARTGIADYHGTQADMPPPAPFDHMTFDDPDVETAFYSFAQTAIAYFQPDYLMFGIEVNLLMRLNPSAWDSYMTLHRHLYTRLKQDYPDLPVFVSMTGIDLLDTYTDADHANQMRAFNDVIDYTDIFALSMYPYMTRFMTTPYPTDMYDQLATLTDKPMAISETGYPAQTFSIQVDPGPRLTFTSDDTKQADYIRYLLDEAQQHQFVFVVNFVLRDYDDLWQAIGGQEDLTIAWRDTGLYAEDGRERPSLAIWRDVLALPFAGTTGG